MKVYFFKIALFAVLFIGLLFTATKMLSLKVEKKAFTNFNNEENLYSIKNNTHYDLLFMGISHARNFSRFKNQIRVEKILECKLINIARGGGKCGTEAEYIYLKHFYSRGNTVDKIIYIPTPPMFFSDYLDINSSVLEYEPFRADFFFHYLMSEQENKGQQLYYYLRFKYKPNWLKYGPYTAESNDNVLEKYDTTVIKDGFKLAFPKGLDSITFNRNKTIVKKTIELCIKNKTQVIFLMTPSMFGKWPGNDRIFDYLNSLKSTYPIDVYDYSEVCKDSTYYYDHHHFNSKGVSWFAQNYILPVLQAK